MADMQVDIFGNAEGVARMFGLLSIKLSPPGLVVFLESYVDPYLAERARQRFAAEGDSASGAWQQLKESTQHFRSTSGFPPAHPINRRTGELEDYVVHGGGDAYPTGLGAQLDFPRPAGSSTLSAKMKRAQKGDSRTVARPVAVVNEEDLVATLMQLAAWIEQPI